MYKIKGFEFYLSQEQEKRCSAEDLQLEDSKKDPKEIAEHIMLVDLGRNDVSRVCEAGSVV